MATLLQFVPVCHTVQVNGLVLDVPPKDDVDDTDVVDYPLHPVVGSFKEAIEANPEFSMFFNQMFIQIPISIKKSPQNYHQMLQLMSHVLTKAAEFSPNRLSIMVSIPMFAILRQPIVTSGGYAAF